MQNANLCHPFKTISNYDDPIEGEGMKIAFAGAGGINKVHGQAAKTWGLEGWTNMKAVDAAYKSSETGIVVEVR